MSAKSEVLQGIKLKSREQKRKLFFFKSSMRSLSNFRVFLLSFFSFRKCTSSVEKKSLIINAITNINQFFFVKIST